MPGVLIFFFMESKLELHFPLSLHSLRRMSLPESPMTRHVLTYCMNFSGHAWEEAARGRSQKVTWHWPINPTGPLVSRNIPLFYCTYNGLF